MIRVAENRHAGPRLDDLVRVDPGDVGDHHVRRINAVGRDEMVRGQQPLQLGAEEEVDPDEQDRGHTSNLPPSLDDANNPPMSLERGLERIRAGAYFDAHEELEDEWRDAPHEERNFLQGLVHVAVAWYQAERGNRPGCERQLAKATRRLAPYTPEHRGVAVERTLRSVDEAAALVATGTLKLPAPEL